MDRRLFREFCNISARIERRREDTNAFAEWFSVNNKQTALSARVIFSWFSLKIQNIIIIKMSLCSKNYLTITPVTVKRKDYLRFCYEKEDDHNSYCQAGGHCYRRPA